MRSSFVRILFIAAASTVACLFLIKNQFPNPSYLSLFFSKSEFAPSDSENVKCQKCFHIAFSKGVDQYRTCLRRELKTDPWRYKTDAVKRCIANSRLRRLNKTILHNRDQENYVILPGNVMVPENSTGTIQTSELVAVTLGIGQDINAEEKLHNLLPNCTFYGADPIRASGQIFERVGKYFEIAVSGEAGRCKARVLEGDVYVMKPVLTVTLLDFLTDYVRTPKVDFLIIDNEGAEYNILPHLLNGGIVEKHGVIICQFTVEMHGPLKRYGISSDRVNYVIRSLLLDSPFVPIWAYVRSSHLRAYYINVVEPYCINTFYRGEKCDL